MDDKGLINSQEEYEREMQKFNDECTRIKKNMFVHPFKSHRDFLNLLDNSEMIGLFSHEDCNKVRLQLSAGLKNADIKDYIKRKIRSMYDKRFKK